ncbi:MAG: hypothetical protein AB1779_07975, partial [Candidatus Thermoplasmatota archaeon]
INIGEKVENILLKYSINDIDEKSSRLWTGKFDKTMLSIAPKRRGDVNFVLCGSFALEEGDGVKLSIIAICLVSQNYVSKDIEAEVISLGETEKEKKVDSDKRNEKNEVDNDDDNNTKNRMNLLPLFGTMIFAILLWFMLLRRNRRRYGF